MISLWVYFITWVYVVGFICGINAKLVSSVTKVQSEIVTISQAETVATGLWQRGLSWIWNSERDNSCGPNLLSCNVIDPTRLEAPWHGNTRAFPQCYDTSKYVCSENFLCPVNAPKIPGTYACGPYNTASASSTAVSPPIAPPNCGPGLHICEVQDPTRLEAPWHGVESPFPQCYDPALYTCAENFLCPIQALKINGKYACGPYLASSATLPASSISTLLQSSASASSPGIIESSSSVILPSSSSRPTSEVSTSTGQPLSLTATLLSGSLGSISTGQSVSSRIPTFSSDHASSIPTGQTSSSILDSSLGEGSSSTRTGQPPSSTLASLPGEGSSATQTRQPSSSTLASSRAEGSSTIPSGQSSSPPVSSLTGILSSVTTGQQSSGLSSLPGSLSPPSTGEQQSSTGISLPGSSNISGTPASAPNSFSNTNSLSTSVPPVSGPSSPTSQTSTDASTPNSLGSTLLSAPSSILSASSLPLSLSGSGASTLPSSVNPGSDTSTNTGTSIISETTPAKVVIGGTTYPFPSISTTIDDNGTSIVLGPSGIVVGSDTIGFPSATGPLALTTDGVTLTFDPAASDTPPKSVGTSLISSGIVLDGTTFSFPATPTTLIEANGDTVVLGPSGIVIGSDSISLPNGPTTVTTDGLTFTLDPSQGPSSTLVTSNISGGGGTSFPIPVPSDIIIDGSTVPIGSGLQTITEPDGEVITFGPSGIISGGNIINFPTSCNTLTLGGITLGAPCTATSLPLSTSPGSSSTGPLPIYATWPPDFSVIIDSTAPIITGSSTSGTHILVTTSTTGRDSRVTPVIISVPELPCLICGCWFCPPGPPGFDLFGNLPAGIYPPPPPNILPTGFSSIIPSITIGYDRNPTYSSNTEEPSCTTTQTASDCSVRCSATTTSEEPTCTTACYATTTGCSVTGTTTTTTVQPPTTRPPCAYPQANAQAKAKRKAKPLTATRVVKPRKLPEPTQYPGGLDQLLATAYTYNGPLISVTWVGYHRTRMVPGVGLVGQSEATHRPFGQLPFILGWNELIGCTVFVAVSPRGVWTAHFWENDWNSGEERFNREIMDNMEFGAGPLMPGFGDVIPQYFGRDPATGQIDTSIFVFSILTNSPDDDPDSLAFGGKVMRVIHRMNLAISNGFPNEATTVRILGYVSNPGPASVAEDSAGKVIFEYSPAYHCAGPAYSYAHLRLYFQDVLMLDRHIANPPQRLTNPGFPLSPADPPFPLYGKRDDPPCVPNTEIGTDYLYVVPTTSTIWSYSAPQADAPLPTLPPPATPTTGSVFCAPTPNSMVVPTGISSNDISSSITYYCSFVLDSTQGGIGCSAASDPDENCDGTVFTAYPFPFEYTGGVVWFNISLQSGTFSTFSADTCDSALNSVLNECSLSPGVLPLEGSIPVQDGSGGVIDFGFSIDPDTISTEPPSSTPSAPASSTPPPPSSTPSAPQSTPPDSSPPSSTSPPPCSTVTASVCTEFVTVDLGPVGPDHQPTATVSSLSCSPTVGCGVSDATITSTAVTTASCSTVTATECTEIVTFEFNTAGRFSSLASTEICSTTLGCAGVINNATTTTLATGTLTDCTTSTADICTYYLTWNINAGGKTETSMISSSCSETKGCTVQGLMTTIVTETTDTVSVPTATTSAGQLEIGAQYFASKSGSFWVTQDTKAGSNTNFCNAKTGISIENRGDSEAYPVSLGPFSTNGFTGCTYDGKSDAVGTLTCPGQFKVQCVEDTTDKNSCTKTKFQGTTCTGNSYVYCGLIRCTIPPS